MAVTSLGLRSVVRRITYLPVHGISNLLGGDLGVIGVPARSGQLSSSVTGGCSDPGYKKSGTALRGKAQ